MTCRSESRLPTMPSELLKLALNDLRKMEKTPGCTIDMSLWVRFSDGVCYCCLAGAVMMRRLDADLSCCPIDLPAEQAQLEALDRFRVGQIASGLGLLRIALPEGMPAVVMTVSYSLDRDAWFASMEKTVGMFKEAGL